MTDKPKPTSETEPSKQTGVSELERLLAKEGRSVTFRPFGAADDIRLTIPMVQNDIAVRTKSGKTCSEQDARKFIMLCQAQRLNPWQGDAYCIGYDGRDGIAKFSLITAHQVFLKRAETSPQFDGLESGIILQVEGGQIIEREGDFAMNGEQVVGGWCKVYLKNRSKPVYKRLAIEQRKPIYKGRDGETFSTPFWEGHKAYEQIVKCAEGDALRTAFPSLLGGLYTGEEQDIGRIVAESTRSAFGMNVAPPAAESPAPRPSPEPPTEPEDNVPMDSPPKGGAPTGTGEPQAPKEKAPEPQGSAASPASTAKTEQEKLAEIVLGAGFTFSDFVQFVSREQLVPNADSLADFSEVPKANAARLLRATSGMLAGLKAIKEGKA